MESMIPILQRSFVLRQTIFNITFRQIFSLFDLIINELDEILEMKFKKDKIIISFIDKNKQQSNDNNFNLLVNNSYDLDDIIGSNYRKRNSKRKFSLSKSSSINGLFNDQSNNNNNTIIPKINSFEDLSSLDSQQYNNFSLSYPLPPPPPPPSPSQENNIIQFSFIETETICDTEVVEQISTVEISSCESLTDIKVKSDNISQSVKTLTENEESIVESPKIENTDQTTTTTTTTTITKPIKTFTENEESMVASPNDLTTTKPTKSFTENEESIVASPKIENEESEAASSKIENKGSVAAPPKIENEESEAASQKIENEESIVASPKIENEGSVAASPKIENEDSVAASPKIENTDLTTKTTTITKPIKTFTENEESMVASPKTPKTENTDTTTTITKPIKTFTENEESMVAPPKTPKTENTDLTTITTTITTKPIKTFTDDEESVVVPPIITSINSTPTKPTKTFTENEESIVASPIIEVAASPIIENEESVAASPKIENEESVAASPKIESEESVAASPKIESEEPVATSPIIENEESVAASPKIENEESVAVPPKVESEESVVASPIIENEEPVAAVPIIENEESVAASPKIESEESVAASPKIESEEPVAASPIIENEESVVASPKIESEESVATSQIESEEPAATSQIESEESVAASPKIENESVVASPKIENEEPVATSPIIENEESVVALPKIENEGSVAAPPKIENEPPIIENTDLTTTTITTSITSKPTKLIKNDVLIEEELSKKFITSVLSLKDKRLERATSRVPPSFNANIPVDIFIEICYYLPPASLFSLMCVCKQFRFWLNSSASYVTQDIWRTSRLKYLDRIKLRPPVGMDELSYIKLTMLEQGCQFCGTRDETPKVYWAFRVRCCQACLKKRVTSPENLPKWTKSPVDITMLVSYENINALDSDGKIAVYWNSHLEQTRRECMSTPQKHRSAWIQKKKHWVSETLKEVVKRERIDDLYCRKQSLEDERIFRTLLDEFRQIKDEKGQQKYIDKYVSQLPTYIEAQNTWKIPFMTNPWPNFIDRLKIEYPKVMNKASRLQQLTDTMLSLITSYVTLASNVTISSEQGYQIYLTDPVIDCLQWCPSFINPPYVKDNANIPWTEDYLIKTLIPKLRKEARHLLRRSDIKRPGPFTSVRGCKNLIKNEVEDKEFFKCKLCWKSARKLYNYEGICRHLTSGRHSIARIDDERMIEVDREKVKKLLPVWFASFY